MSTMRQLHQQYETRVRRGEYIQAWCIAHEGLRRARVMEQVTLWQSRVEVNKRVVNAKPVKRRAA